MNPNTVLSIDSVCGLMLEDAKSNSQLLAVIISIQEDYIDGILTNKERFCQMLVIFLDYFQILTVCNQDERIEQIFTFRDGTEKPDECVDLENTSWVDFTN